MSLIPKTITDGKSKRNRGKELRGRRDRSQEAQLRQSEKVGMI